MPYRNLAAPLLRTVHILSISAWIGGGFGIVLLLILDQQAASANDLRAFNRVIDAVDDWIVAPGAFTTLISGVALARARGMSVMRTNWLKFKFYSSTVAIVFGLFFVARWLEKLMIYSTRDDFAVFDDRLYSQAYLVGTIGCAVQAAIVFVMLAVSVLHPRFHSRRCSSSARQAVHGIA